MNKEEEQIKIVYVVKSYTEAQKKACQKYYQANKEKILQKQIARAKERYYLDPEFREKQVTRMRDAMRRKSKKAAAMPTTAPENPKSENL